MPVYGQLILSKQLTRANLTSTCPSAISAGRRTPIERKASIRVPSIPGIKRTAFPASSARNPMARKHRGARGKKGSGGGTDGSESGSSGGEEVPATPATQPEHPGDGASTSVTGPGGSGRGSTIVGPGTVTDDARKQPADVSTPQGGTGSMIPGITVMGGATGGPVTTDGKNSAGCVTAQLKVPAENVPSLFRFLILSMSADVITNTNINNVAAETQMQTVTHSGNASSKGTWTPGASRAPAESSYGQQGTWTPSTRLPVESFYGKKQKQCKELQQDNKLKAEGPVELTQWKRSTRGGRPRESAGRGRGTNTRGRGIGGTGRGGRQTGRRSLDRRSVRSEGSETGSGSQGQRADRRSEAEAVRGYEVLRKDNTINPVEELRKDRDGNTWLLREEKSKTVWKNQAGEFATPTEVDQARHLGARTGRVF